jgi:hypothetical protein
MTYSSSASSSRTGTTGSTMSIGAGIVEERRSDCLLPGVLRLTIVSRMWKSRGSVLKREENPWGDTVTDSGVMVAKRLWYGRTEE